MRIVHRIGLTANADDRDQIERLGIRIPPMGNVSPGFVAFDVAEGEEAWPAVRAWLESRRPSDVVRTEYSAQEVDRARWLSMEPEWHHGYPQPNEGEFGYRQVTFDLADYCPACGTGKRQKAAFVMKGEPHWGRRGILQLNWVFDEFFATPEVWTATFASHGIASRPVVDKRGAELKTVVQLVVDERVSVRVDGLTFEQCSTCGRPKYLPVVRGPIPPLLSEPLGHMARTSESFGSGGSSFNLIVVSHALAAAIRGAKVKGATFTPISESPGP